MSFPPRLTIGSPSGGDPFEASHRVGSSCDHPDWVDQSVEVEPEREPFLEGGDIDLERGASIEAPLRVQDSANRILSCEESCCRFFIFGGREAPQYADVGFIGDGNTTLLEFRAQAVHIYSLCATPIEAVYNSATTRWSSRSITSDSRRVRILREGWDLFFDRCRNENLLRLQFCVGDGVYIVREALRGYPHSDRILVIAFAPSCRISDESCLSVIHYRSYGEILSSRGPSGGEHLQTVALPRHSESRGVLDVGICSSTFFLLIQMEALCFSLRQRYEAVGCLPVDFDIRWQNMRNRFVNDGGLNREAREIERRNLLVRFFADYGEYISLTSFENLYEVARCRYPVREVERVIYCIDCIRDCTLLTEAVSVLAVFNAVVPIVVIPAGVLELLNGIRIYGLSFIPRYQDRSGRVRMIALRLQFVELLMWLYEVGLLGYFIANSETPGFLFSLVGVRVIVTGANLLSQTLVQLIPSLRGRIERSLTNVERGNIQTSRLENHPARQIGLISRLGRSLTRITYGIAAPVIVGALSYPLLYLSEEGGTTDFEEFLSERTRVITTCILGVSGLLSVASVILNLRQSRSIIRTLRENLNLTRTEVGEERAISLQELRSEGAEASQNSAGVQDNNDETLVVVERETSF